MKVMKVDVDIVNGVKMNCGIVSAGVTARTNRKHNNVELGILFGWAHGVNLQLPMVLSVFQGLIGS